MIFLESNITPPPVSSNHWINFFGYTLITIQAIFIGLIIVRYARAVQRTPMTRRLLPLHVILVGLGTFLLSAVSVARAIQFPFLVWGVASLISIAMIDVALYLIWTWQRQQNRPL